MIAASRRLAAVTPLAALILAMSGVVASTTTASAAADGCVWSEPTPISCVQVWGASLRVDSARAGVDLAVRQSARGHFHVYATGPRGFSEVSRSDVTYWNQSWVHHHTFWGPSASVMRDLPNGTRVCGEFVEYKGGRYIDHTPACVTVHA